MAKVDIPAFKKELEKILGASSVQSAYRVSKRTNKYHRQVYALRGDNFTYEAALDDKWIGYDLYIVGGDGVLGADMSVDTDNYPIYGAPHEEVAADIFREGIQLLRQILDGKVLYSLGSKATILAIEAGSKKYLVKKEKKGFLGFYSSTTQEMPAKEVAHMNLQRLR